MWGWLGRLFGRPRAHFPRCKREIFRYWDGTHYVDGDPLLIGAALATSEDFNVELDAKRSLIPGDIGIHAYVRLLTGVRKCFAIPEVSAGGLDSKACEQLLLTFQQYCAEKKSTTPTLPTAAPLSLDIPVEPSPLPKSSDSKSTESVESAELPLESPSGSNSPSETHPIPSGT